MDKITKEKFEKNWVAMTGCRATEMIQRYGFAAVPCDCGESGCEGWRMLTREQRKGDAEAKQWYDRKKAGMKLKPASLCSVMKFAKANGARGVVVLVFSDDQYGVTSYGRNKKDCKAMQKLADVLVRPIIMGSLEPWK